MEAMTVLAIQDIAIATLRFILFFRYYPVICEDGTLHVNVFLPRWMPVFRDIVRAPFSVAKIGLIREIGSVLTSISIT
jgi:hypothetical protein